MNRITKEDTQVLSEAYAQVISEALPGSGREEGKMPGMPAGAQAMPFEAGGGAGKLGEPESLATYQIGNPERFKAFVSYCGAKCVGRMLGDFPKKYENWQSILEKIITKCGKKVLADIEASESKQVPDTRKQMQLRLGNYITTFALMGEKLFNKDISEHVGRNVLDALERAGVIVEVDRVNKAGKQIGTRSKSVFSGPASKATAEDLSHI